MHTKYKLITESQSDYLNTLANRISLHLMITRDEVLKVNNNGNQFIYNLKDERNFINRTLKAKGYNTGYEAGRLNGLVYLYNEL